MIKINNFKLNSEESMQSALMAWASVVQNHGWFCGDYWLEGLDLPLRGDPVPELHWLHHVPNGGRRDKATAALMKKQGVKSGVSDLFWPLKVNGNSGLYIELKFGNNGMSDAQKDFANFVEKNGFLFYCVSDVKRAAQIIKSYYLEVL